jgi:hypothetical protein
MRSHPYPSLTVRSLTDFGVAEFGYELCLYTFL